MRGYRAFSRCRVPSCYGFPSLSLIATSQRRYSISEKAFFIAPVAVAMASSVDILLSDLSNGSVPTGPSYPIFTSPRRNAFTSMTPVVHGSLRGESGIRSRGMSDGASQMSAVTRVSLAAMP